MLSPLRDAWWMRFSIGCAAGNFDASASAIAQFLRDLLFIVTK
jgi:hypothetical protein